MLFHKLAINVSRFLRINLIRCTAELIKKQLRFHCAAKGTQHVTCGSVLKLMNVDFKVRLHSHDIKYGSGSGQQSVTGISTKEDGNSYWLIKAETKRQCVRGYVTFNELYTLHFL